MKKILVVALLSTMGVAQAQLSEIQSQVLEDHNKLMSMTTDQRRDYRQQILGNLSKSEQMTYKRTYKTMVETNTITDQSGMFTRRANTNKGKSVSRNPGTSITYDTGAGTVPGATASFTEGNVFDNAFNAAAGGIFPVEAAGSITQITFSAAVVTGSAAWVSIYTALNTGAATANGFDSGNNSGVVTGLNTLAVAHTGVTGPFIVGVWNSGDMVNFDTNSVNGQGFHGAEINDGGGNTFAYKSNLNAVVRVSGNVTTPVELMNFSVE